MDFNHAISIFGSRMKALEILLLLEDQKLVVRQGFYDHEFKKVEEFCKKNNVFLSKSKFKVSLEGKEKFTNKGKIINESEKGMHFVYLSKDEEKALLANLYETKQDHKQLGQILGYPECCINFFINNFSQENPNPVHKPTNPWTNLSKREFDVCLLSHFPCTNDCQESISLAKKHYDLLLKHDPPAAQLIYQELSVR